MCYSSRLSQGQHCQVDAHLFSLTALPFPTLYSQVPTAGSTRVSNGLARAHLGLDNTALISPETKKWKKKERVKMAPNTSFAPLTTDHGLKRSSLGACFFEKLPGTRLKEMKPQLF